MSVLFEVAILPSAKGSGTNAKDLYRQLRDAISDGRLPAGARLPPTRKSAVYFSTSRNTMVQVYERLVSGGYATARHGSGTYVANVAERRDTQAPPSVPEEHSFPLNPFWLQPKVHADMGFWRDDPAESKPIKIDFRPALVDSRTFPMTLFRQLSARQLRRLENRPPRFKSPQGNAGNYSLRSAITSHIGTTRAVVAGPDEVVVTSGAQQAFDLLARVLVDRNKTVVVMEDPGYPPMRVAFAASGARVVPVPVDEEGLIVDRLPEDATVICVTPSHQFPLGATLSLRRRRALIEFARTHGAVIVEDDYDGEFRYTGAAVEALRTAEAADVVFFVGTFSKCMLPSLRLGFIVAPAWAHPTLVAAKNCLDWHCSTPIQMAVAAFIADGHLVRHIRKMRTLYEERRRLLLYIVKEKLDSWLKPIPSFYGMHITATARPQSAADPDEIAALAKTRGVHVHSLDRYYAGPPQHRGLVFGYGATGPADIEAGLDILTETFLATC